MKGEKVGWRRPRVLLEPRDLWIGVYWTRHQPLGDDGCILGEWLKIYVCVLPMFPLVLSRWRPDRETDRYDEADDVWLVSRG